MTLSPCRIGDAFKGQDQLRLIGVTVLQSGLARAFNARNSQVQPGDGEQKWGWDVEILISPSRARAQTEPAHSRRRPSCDCLMTQAGEHIIAEHRIYNAAPEGSDAMFFVTTSEQCLR
ncbi:hypothetical protein ACXYMP_05205 [Aliiroseovarius sp. CAU 1755]